jgi:G-protein coupled receptor 98
MPVLSASLLSTALPVVVALLATVALLSHSCVYWSRWEDFHNIYHDSFNKVEIPLLIGFFSVISLSAVAGYLHAYIGVVYTFAIFCIVNIIEVRIIIMFTPSLANLHGTVPYVHLVSPTEYYWPGPLL